MQRWVGLTEGRVACVLFHGRIFEKHEGRGREDLLGGVVAGETRPLLARCGHWTGP